MEFFQLKAAVLHLQLPPQLLSGSKWTNETQPPIPTTQCFTLLLGKKKKKEEEEEEQELTSS